jgi:hypothetical protein
MYFKPKPEKTYTIKMDPDKDEIVPVEMIGSKTCMESLSGVTNAL